MTVARLKELLSKFEDHEHVSVGQRRCFSDDEVRFEILGVSVPRPKGPRVLIAVGDGDWSPNELES